MSFLMDTHNVNEYKYAIVYYRKSTSPRKGFEEHAVEYQQLAIQQFAEQNSLEIVEEYTDVARTGTNQRRPGLQKLLKDLRSRKHKEVILLLYSVDRLGRDLRGNIELIQEIEQRIPLTYFVTNNLASDSESFKMLFTLSSAMAQESRDTLMKGLALGRKSKVIKNKTFDGNKPPLGYIQDNTTKVLKPASNKNTNEISKIEELLMLRYIFYCFLFGMSLRSIAYALNQHFGPSKRSFKRDNKTIKYILSNPTYVGVLTGVLEKNQHYWLEDAKVIPIIDPTIFQLIGEQLKLISSGRKKKNILFRAPNFNICVGCLSPIEKVDEHTIGCPKCHKTVSEQMVLNLINETLINHIKGNYPMKNNLESLKKDVVVQYSSKLEKLHYKLADLNKRTEYVMKLGSTKIKEHTEVLKEVRKEIFLTKAMVKVFVTFSSDELEEITERRNYAESLVKLPYLVLIDFTKKEADLVFHSDIFINVEGYQIESDK